MYVSAEWTEAAVRDVIEAYEGGGERRLMRELEKLFRRKTTPADAAKFVAILIEWLDQR
jgi:hypothetical protein